METNLTKWLKENGNPNPKLPVPPKEELEFWYWEKKESGRKLASRYGVTQMQIRRWFKYHGIKARTYKDNPTPTPKGGTHSWGDKISKTSFGKPATIKGATHWNYKGGITPINAQIRNSVEYKDWRRQVFARDNWTCIICLVRGGTLEADHIKPFSLYPDLRFDIPNGRTLCRDCHLEHGWQFFKVANPRKKAVQ